MNRFPSLTRRRCTLLLLLGGAAGLPLLPAQDAVPFFNGKDLSGWKVPLINPFWKVTDGVIMGENDETKRGSMLWTERLYGDFEMEAEAKWSGEIDSGIMMRKPVLQLQLGVSRSLKQDMTGCFYFGGYPEQGQSKDRATLVKEGEWNHYRIRAKGDTFTVWINGTETVRYQNAQCAAPGPIGLQIHDGLAMKVEFRHLKLKEL